MSTSPTLSRTASRYLHELQTALAGAPSSVRTELLADVTAELDGLDDDRAASRIRELGDPYLIAADASDASEGSDDGSPEARGSRTYPTLTVLVLIFGGYLVPVVGWMAGLIMIGLGSGWSAAVRRRAILISVAGVVASLLVLLVAHATGRSAGLAAAALIVVLLIPFVVNVVVGRRLNREWGRG